MASLRLASLAMLVALASPALAQQPPDIATLQKAISVIQQQRNQAYDAQAGAEVRAATLAEENAKLKAQVQALEAKTPKDKPEQPQNPKSD